MWEITAAIIGSLTGLLTAIWGIIKYYDRKREKQSNKQNAFVEETKAENKEQTQQINKIMHKVSKLEQDVEYLKEDAKNIHKNMSKQEGNINDNEMSRLQTAIMDFALYLRNGKTATLNSFNYIYHAYDKYKSLGGNSFVDSEMEYIKEQKNKSHFVEEEKENDND